jgi:hypothetical protein
MLKIITLVLFTFTLFIAVPAIAGQADSNTGCGLGTVLWEGKADDSTLFQVFQVTTNGTSGNQTFGITTGTLGCSQPASIAASERLKEFSGANLDALALDISKGQGEALDTLAELMNIPAAEQAQFASNLQGHFDKIFVTGNENSATVLDRIYVLI